ncbi:MAG TPA: peptidoglycan-associated lipoprotein Pal [Solimonas sp.]
MSKNLVLSVLVVSALALTACSSAGKRTADDGRGQGSTTQSGMPYTDNISGSTSQVGGEGGYDAAVAAERALSTNIIYFDYDQSTVKAEYQGVVDSYARYLSSNPAAKVRLEGHTDERGTREYNIGLGERRASAVQSALLAQGVSGAQVSIISYGEERPAASGRDESAYAENRRVQIIRQ